MSGKAREAFRSISEAAAELGLAQHVLRFWETQLPFVRPVKRAGGRRFYRPRDLALLDEVRRLRDQGRPLSEIRRLHGQRRLGGRPSADPEPPTADARAAERTAAFRALLAAKRRLDALLPAR